MQISNPNFQGFDFTTSFPTLFDFHCTVHWAQYDKHVTLQFDHWKQGQWDLPYLYICWEGYEIYQIPFGFWKPHIIKKIIDCLKLNVNFISHKEEVESFNIFQCGFKLMIFHKY